MRRESPENCSVAQQMTQGIHVALLAVGLLAEEDPG
jgi:hypothetical protein